MSKQANSPQIVDREVAAADGTRLRTTVYLPAAGHWPTIVMRTPYGADGLHERALKLCSSGYSVVVQDVRGSGQSHGELSYFAEASDGADTATWISQQEWFDGCLVAAGGSYLGFAALALASRATVPVAALAISIYGSDRTSAWFPGGSINLELVLPWTVSRAQNLSGDEFVKLLTDNDHRLRAAYLTLPMSNADLQLGGSTVPLFQDLLTHGPASGHWDDLKMLSVLTGSGVPTLLVAGWYDYQLPHMVADYERLQHAGTDSALVLGPWTHATVDEKVEVEATLAWLEHVRGQNPRDPRPVQFYVLPDVGWANAEVWPPRAQNLTHFRMTSAGSLAADGSPDSPDDAGDSESVLTSYVYDPTDPTPALAGAAIAPPPGSGPVDNRVREERDDVAVFTSDPLIRASEVVVGGECRLRVKVAEPHVDFCIRLCDVDEEGISTNVADGFLRLNPDDFSLAADGGKYFADVRIGLDPTCYLFRAGHRVRLHVSSGAHPIRSRNPGTGEAIKESTTLRSNQITLLSGVWPHCSLALRSIPVPVTRSAWSTPSKAVD